MSNLERFCLSLLSSTSSGPLKKPELEKFRHYELGLVFKTNYHFMSKTKLVPQSNVRFITICDGYFMLVEPLKDQTTIYKLVFDSSFGHEDLTRVVRIDKITQFCQQFESVVCHVAGHFIADYTVFKLPGCTRVQTLSINSKSSCPVDDSVLISFSSEDSVAFLWRWSGREYKLIHHHELSKNAKGCRLAQKSLFYANSVLFVTGNNQFNLLCVHSKDDLRYASRTYFYKAKEDVTQPRKPSQKGNRQRSSTAIVEFRQTRHARQIIVLDSVGRVSLVTLTAFSNLTSSHPESTKNSSQVRDPQSIQAMRTI